MADYNAIDTTEDWQRKLAQGTRLGESLDNGKGGEVLPSTKNKKIK